MGWDVAAHELEITEARTGLINSCPLSLSLTAEPRSPMSIQQIHWYNQLAEGEPVVPWDALLALWKRAEEAVTNHPWLGEWIASGGEVSLVAHDSHGYACDSLENWVLPAWRDAGHAGTPDFQLSLSGSDSGYANVYLGTDETTSIVTYSALKGSGRHWLYGKEVHYHPTRPEYLVVTPDGQFERQRIDRR